MSDQKLFDAIDKLIATLPPDPAKVGEVLGTRIVRNPAADSGAVEAYVQAADVKGGAFETVDLRMPDPDIGDKTVFLSVTLRPDNGLDQVGICARFGTDFHAQIPSPRYKPGSVPVYLVFDKPWGELSFGVTADEDRKLVRFIVSTRGPEST
jgi:hypothetical protein